MSKWKLVWFSGLAQDSQSVGREFEPCYGQRVMSLGKTSHSNCLVDLSTSGSCWGIYYNLSAHRFSADLAFGCNKNLVYSEMVVMIS